MSISGTHSIPPIPPARTQAARGHGADRDAKPDRVALADASKRGIGNRAAKAAGVHFEDTAAAADKRIREARLEEQREERLLARRDAAQARLEDSARTRHLDTEA